MATDSKLPEFEPPQACVNRAIKTVLPDSVQITKEARAAFTRAAGVFIFYLTHCANDICRDAKRQTISVNDVMTALRELDFEDFEKPVEEFLEQYRKEVEASKKSPSTTKMKKSLENSKTNESGGTISAENHGGDATEHDNKVEVGQMDTDDIEDDIDDNDEDDAEDETRDHDEDESPSMAH